jgi:hypothetical protein
MGSRQVSWCCYSHLSLWSCHAPRVCLHCWYAVNSLSTITKLTKHTVMPVFWFTPPEIGGFGFSPLQISLLLGAVGMSQALWTLLAFPPLQRRWGTGGVLRACTIVWPIFFAMNPLSSFFLRQKLTVAFWIVGPAFSVIATGVSIAFSKFTPSLLVVCISLSNSLP